MKGLLLLVFSLSSLLAFAGHSEEQAYLRAIAEQLSPILPLIEAASQQQAVDAQPQFHYDDFMDHNGLRHPGLRQDIEAIRAAILAKLAQDASPPAGAR